MNAPPENKWEDLDELDSEEIKQIIQQKKSLLRSLENEVRELRSERKDQVHIVKSLRSAIGGFEASDSGRKRLLGEFHRSRKEAQKQRGVRDSINKCIPPPSNILEDWLRETYSILTKIDNDLTEVPMLNPELSGFRRFFEIQASIVRKRQAEEAHAKYVSKVAEMRKISGKLDENDDESQRAVSELKNSTDIGEDKISRKEINRISKRIAQIDHRLDEIKIGISETRKELKRVEDYSRISARRPGRVKISDIRDIAAKGGTLSTEEMGALLESGGLSSIEGPGEVDEEAPRETKARKKGRKLGVSRRGSRRGSIASRRE
ncbi:MAG: hypothetical protein CMA88_01635 [Euryarchaeota archaeon]|nr:hypothetical protein [Euryarchaeota archaeon]|tara:strand:- start:507 stop:1466 length:960 start_codon:yes stop_codon:yes gene_type:complete